MARQKKNPLIPPASEELPPVSLPEDPKPQCSNCKFWHEIKGINVTPLGYCKRVPLPIASPSKLTPFGPLIVFSVAPGDEYCHQHEFQS